MSTRSSKQHMDQHMSKCVEETLLINAACRFRFSDTRRLIQNGADTNFMGGSFEWPLTCCLCACHKEIPPSFTYQDGPQARLLIGKDVLKDLLKRRAHRQRPDSNFDALYFATTEDNQAAVELLLEFDAPVDAPVLVFVLGWT